MAEQKAYTVTINDGFFPNNLRGEFFGASVVEAATAAKEYYGQELGCSPGAIKIVAIEEVAALGELVQHTRRAIDNGTTPGPVRMLTTDELFKLSEMELIRHTMHVDCDDPEYIETCNIILSSK